MKRGKHSLSHYKLFTHDMGELVPAGCFEVLPGDTVQQTTSMLTRFAPMLAPVMHPTQIRIHHWYVPYRIIWDDFEDFITGGPDGNDNSNYPTIDSGSGFSIGSLGDYLGVPTGVGSLDVSALPFRAYAAIYNEFYRDQDLITPLTVDTTSGADTTTSTDLQRIAWEKDYFTSSRPEPQKGDAVTISLGDTAPIRVDGFDPSSSFGENPRAGLEVNGTLSTTVDDPADGRFYRRYGSEVIGSDTRMFGHGSADLSGVSGISVQTLREALALQRFKEARSRYGSRYTEYLRYLGVKSSDARLQRPEYLGGGKTTAQFSEVLQTAEGTNAVGTLRGHGVSGVRTNRYRRFFEEHGVVMTLISVRPKTIYQDGLFRMWNRRDKDDFWQRELQHIGQQEILNKEVYAAHSSPDDVFGYQDRYDEYRRHPSQISGEFRDSTLNFWHLARQFGSDPALNESFVEADPSKRIFASTATDALYQMAQHSIQARRLVAQTGTSYIY